MTEFIRARNAEQKEQRMNEIMEAADRLFSTQTYHEITLTTIAESLEWSRANLYKYVTTKEDIFIALFMKNQKEFYSSIKTSFPIGSDYSFEVFAEVMAGLLNSHRDFLNYFSILSNIIETNVSLERLTEFKIEFFEIADANNAHIGTYLHISLEKVAAFFETIIYHANGINNTCNLHPNVQKAMEQAGIQDRIADFKPNMKDFILMCLNHYCSK